MADFNDPDKSPEEKLVEAARKTSDWSQVPPYVIEIEAAHIVLTTSMFVAQKEVDEEIEIITAECVFGMNIFRDVFAGFRDIFGGRSAETQKVLRDARQVALSELRREALIVGADAVINIDLDYQELSGGGKLGMLMIVASGTAVKLIGGPRSSAREIKRDTDEALALETTNDRDEVVETGTIMGRDFKRFRDGKVEVITLSGPKRFNSLAAAQAYLR